MIPCPFCLKRLGRISATCEDCCGSGEWKNEYEQIYYDKQKVKTRAKGLLGELINFLSLDEGTYAYTARKDLTLEYAWAIPNNEALEELVKLSPIIEIGPGTGYWMYLLRYLEARVIGFDNHSWKLRQTKQWTRIEKGTSEVLKRGYFKKHTLFLCWPPYSSNMAEVALKRFKGNSLVYIGEGYGGCTGNDRFHQLLERDWELVKEIDIPQWWALHDQMYVYKRRPKERFSNLTKEKGKRLNRRQRRLLLRINNVL